MEELKSNSELREEVRGWVARARSRLEGDASRKMVLTGPFCEPWTHVLAVSEAISENLRWREVAPNPSPRMRCLQVAHHHNLLEWPEPELAVLGVFPENPFDPPALPQMLEAIRAHLDERTSIGDVLRIKLDNGEPAWAVSVSALPTAPSHVPGFQLRFLSAEEIADLPPSTQSGPKTVTVASPRIDAVAGAVLKPSREQVKRHLESGGVLLNYEIARKPGVELAPGDVVAVREGGRFVFREILSETKKGRFRVEVELINGP
jgi:RNA-binding protein YlmH